MAALVEGHSPATRALASKVAVLRKEVAALRKEWQTAQEETLDQQDIDSLMRELLASSGAQREVQGHPPHKRHRPLHEHTRDVIQQVEVDDALGHVKTMASLSGITFTEVNTATSRSGAGDTERTYKLAGTCCRLNFFLTFAVSEKREAQTIVRVAAHVDDACKPELTEFVKRVEDLRSPQLFFQGFAQYARANSERQEVVRQLVRSRPFVVAVPTGYRCPRVFEMRVPHGRVGLTATWELSISESGVVSASFGIAEHLHPSCGPDVEDERRTAAALAKLAVTTDPRTALVAAAEMVAGLKDAP